MRRRILGRSEIIECLKKKLKSPVLIIDKRAKSINKVAESSIINTVREQTNLKAVYPTRDTVLS